VKKQPGRVGIAYHLFRIYVDNFRPPDLVEFVMIPIRKPGANLCPGILFLLN